jgi:hypothetical protein
MHNRVSCQFVLAIATLQDENAFLLQASEKASEAANEKWHR